MNFKNQILFFLYHIFLIIGWSFIFIEFFYIISSSIFLIFFHVAMVLIFFYSGFLDLDMLFLDCELAALQNARDVLNEVLND